MAFIDDLDKERESGCIKIRELFEDIREEADKLHYKAWDLEAEIRKLEEDLRAIDERIAKELEDNVTVDFPRRRRPRLPSPRKGRGELEDQLDEIQDALGGLEFGFKLGNDLQRRYQEDLEGDGATLSFRNPAARLALVDRLENAREELRQVEARLDTIRAQFDELWARARGQRCLDFYPAAELMYLPPRRP